MLSFISITVSVFDDNLDVNGNLVVGIISIVIVIVVIICYI